MAWSTSIPITRTRSFKKLVRAKMPPTKTPSVHIKNHPKAGSRKDWRHPIQANIERAKALWRWGSMSSMRVRGCGHVTMMEKWLSLGQGTCCQKEVEGLQAPCPPQKNKSRTMWGVKLYWEALLWQIASYRFPVGKDSNHRKGQSFINGWYYCIGTHITTVTDYSR